MIIYNKQKSPTLSKFGDSEREVCRYKKKALKRATLLMSFLIPILSKRGYKSNETNKQGGYLCPSVNHIAS